jgi:STE24 endopeptidase
MRSLIVFAVCVAAGPAFAAEAFDADAATRAWIALLGPETVARSNAYFEGGYWLDLFDTVVQVAIAALLLMTGWARGLRQRLEGRFRRFFPITFFFALVFMVAMTALNFPLAVYRNFFREHAYGLSTQTFGAWFGEHMINEAISWVLGALLITGIYRVVRLWPRGWWAAGAGVVMVFFTLLLTAAPVFVEPIFNTYHSMEEGAQKQDILSLAVANGVPANDVFVYDESRQSERITAKVSGMFDTMRISLADNALTRLSPPALRMVMAHEIGHYVLGISTFIGMLALYFALAFWLLDRLLRAVIGVGRWGIRGVEDVAGLPLVFALLSVVLTITLPFYNAIVRHNEYQADIFGINVSREPDGFAEAALKLAQYRKIEPTALELLLFYDHPSGWDRIHMAMQWKSAEMAAGRIPETPPGPPEGFTLEK